MKFLRTVSVHIFHNTLQVDALALDRVLTWLII